MTQFEDASEKPVLANGPSTMLSVLTALRQGSARARLDAEIDAISGLLVAEGNRGLSDDKRTRDMFEIMEARRARRAGRTAG